MEGVGQMFATIDWNEVGGYMLIIGAYLFVAIAGMAIFPPFIICLVVTEGNLNICSAGIWGNGYSSN